jgi:hypothetical protein
LARWARQLSYRIVDERNAHGRAFCRRCGAEELVAQRTAAASASALQRTTFALDTVTWDDALRFSLGVMGHNANGRISAFVVGNFVEGSKIDSAAINAGMRFNF